MCGISGFNWNDEEAVRKMNQALKHRGPDDSGLFTDGYASLGQVRLSIIDLSPAGHQPMFYSRKTGACSRTHHPEKMMDAEVAVVFNGEVYNFQEVKDELVKKGFVFSTKSDTEVILASYLAWGPDCVKRFNGMWAFVVYDLKKKIFFCSRDRMGVKPFHYYLKDGRFIFSSELKGIVAQKELGINLKSKVRKEAVQLYFALGFIPAPFTIYKDVFKLEARQNMIFDLKKKRIVKKWFYYSLPKYRPVYDEKKLIAEGRALLNDAIRLRLIADVPVGAFLSGGLDSSSIVGEMSKFVELKNLHTFSIGFEGKYDETRYINIVKDYFKTRHHHHYFRKKEFKELLPRYSQFYDEPFGDYSGFPTYSVCRLASKNVTVALSGDGGDEVFGGYMTHVSGYRMDMLRKIPKFLRYLGSKMPAKKNLEGFTSAYLLKQAFEISLGHPKYFYAKALADDGIKPDVYKKWTIEKLDHCLKRGDNRLGEALRLHDLLFVTIPDFFLVKVDRTSMSLPIEVRSPFLDYRFAEFSQKIPTEWKQNSSKTKILMRKIIKGLVPEEIVHRGKQGFQPPIDKWILERNFESDLEAANKSLGIVDPDLASFYSDKVLKEHNALYTNYKIRLFLFGLWWKEWVRD